MSSKPKAEYRVGVGASSILMVLVVLAMTAVGLLSFGSARNAEVLTQRNLAMTTAYYEATARAQQKLASMDALLAEAQMESIDEAAIREALVSLDMAEFELWETAGGFAFSFVEDAGYQRQIEIEGVFAFSGNPRYEISRFQLVSHPMEGDFEEFQLIGG